MGRWSCIYYICTDLYRSETLYNLIAEPILQGSGISLQTKAPSTAEKDMAQVANGELLIGFNIPDTLRREYETAGMVYLEFRLSPLQFGRDIYIAYRTNCHSLDNILQGYTLSDQFLRLEASQLTASIRAHRRKLENLNTYFSDLDNTTVIIAPDPNYPAPDIDIALLPPLTEFSNDLKKLDTQRRILYKPAHNETPSEMLTWLSSLLDVPVKICHHSTYQLLCFHDDIQLFGIGANILQEAAWFSKAVEQLLPPLTPVETKSETISGFKQLPFNAMLSPQFWNSILNDQPITDLTHTDMPQHLCGRELFDSWGDYEKIITWSRELPYLSFLRSGGGALMERVAYLERQSHFDAIEISGPSKKDQTSSQESLSIAALKDSCKGKTAYVLGNAASLNELDLVRLMDEDAFWCNRAFEIEKLGVPFSPKYYMFADVLGFKNFGNKVMAVKAGIKFFRHDVYTEAMREWEAELQQQGVIAFNSVADPGMHEGFFSSDAASRTYCGRTVVLDAIQIAAYLGYSRILVGGVDIDYSQPYFFGTSINGRMPEEEAILAFEVARKTLETHGVELKKITNSPRLPLEYVFSPLQLNGG